MVVVEVPRVRQEIPMVCCRDVCDVAHLMLRQEMIGRLGIQIAMPVMQHIHVVLHAGRMVTEKLRSLVVR